VLLARAVRSLRSERRPGNALAALDEYAARYPSGNLLPEASRLRTEALLALGHKGAALAELSRAPSDGGAGGEERRLVRGELRAAEGRWAEALEDFDAVVRARAAAGAAATAKVRARFERALWGRASARSHLGDEAGARAELQECLRRFPQGRFAAQAARLLGELR
jgi:TolA-binding protein